MVRRAGPSIDIAALRTLKTIREVGSISLAARKLDVDQSAVSHTLQRLRRQFNDPLFVRTKHGIVATERCENMARRVEGILARFEQMTQPQAFDPATSDFDVTIGLSHAGLSVLMIRVVHLLRQRAPGVRIRVIEPYANACEALESGSCDLLIRSLPYESLRFHRRHILRDQCVCLVDAGSPYVQNGISLEEYAAASHALITFEGVYRPPWLDRMEAMGMPLHIVLDLANSSEIDELIVGTDIVATVTRHFSETCSNRVKAITAPLEAYQDIYMFWSERTHDRDNFLWLRELIADVAGRLDEADPQQELQP